MSGEMEPKEIPEFYSHPTHPLGSNLNVISSGKPPLVLAARSKFFPLSSRQILIYTSLPVYLAETGVCKVLSYVISWLYSLYVISLINFPMGKGFFFF